MTAEELREWMGTYGYSVRGLGRALGVQYRTVQRWRDGTSKVPPYLTMALRALEGNSSAPPLPAQAESPSG